MVIPAPDSQPLEVRDADGRVIAYLIPVEEMDRRRAEIDSLREQLAGLRRQKAHYVAELTRVLQTSLPIPPTEQEVNTPVPNSEELRKLITELEAR